MPLSRLFTRIASLAAFTLMSANAMGQDLANIDVPFEKHVLDNGLTVLLHVDDSAPLAYVNVYYKVGSRDEVEGKTGFAHLFEHLMFNGTENYDEEYFAAIQQVGGSLNGDTWLDRTRYYQTVPNTALDRVLWLESDRMGHLLGAVTQEKLDQQRGVVQNEKRRKMNQPYAKVWPAMYGELFPEGHPYSWPTIGSMEDLNAATLDDVHEWFKKYYGAANAILIVAGDIDPARTLESVKLHFGDIPAGPPVTVRDDWQVKRPYSTRQIMEDRVSNDRIVRSWVVPGREYDDVLYLQLASSILGGDSSSRLYKRLVKEEQLAISVSLGITPFDLASVATVSAMLVPGADADKVRSIIDEEIARFAADGPTKSELALTKTQLASQVIKGLDSLTGKGVLLAESEYYLGAPDAFKKGYQTVEAARPADLSAVVDAWLGVGFHEIYVKAFADHKVAEVGADRSLGLPDVTTFPPATAPEIVDFELDNGIKVRFVARDGVPAVRLQVISDQGRLTNGQEQPGAAEVVTSALTRGTKSLSADEIIAESKRTGTQINVSVGNHTTAAYMSTLASKIDPATELLADILRNPSFPDSEVQLIKDQYKTSVEQQKKSPASLASRYVNSALFGDHPYGRSPLTAQDFDNLSDDDLRTTYTRLLTGGNLTIFAVGGIDPDELRDALNEHLGDWRIDGPQSDPIDVSMARLQESPARVILIDTPGAPQSNVIAARIIDPPYPADAEAFDLANLIYGGTFTSRINSNIREDKGWSYGVRSSANAPIGPRTWTISAQVQTDKTAASIQELLKELTVLDDARPFSAEELEGVRNQSIRRLPASTASSSNVLSYMVTNHNHGLADDRIETRKAALEAVATDDLTAAFRSRIDAEGLSWFIAGDLAKIEENVRALNLGEVEVWSVDGEKLR